ncbi:DUF4823 domain-containing protein [Achromobacter aloeverae]
MKRALAVLLLSSLTGCVSTHDIQRIAGRPNAMDPAKSVYVAIPPDGGYGGRPVMGSGAQSAQQVAAAFSAHHIVVSLAMHSEQWTQALANARAANAGYVVYPSLSNWEHRATAWSAFPSKVALRVDILSADTGDRVDTSVIEGESASMTFLATDPAKLLPAALDDYVKQLYPAAAQ